MYKYKFVLEVCLHLRLMSALRVRALAFIRVSVSCFAGCVSEVRV